MNAAMYWLLKRLISCCSSTGNTISNQTIGFVSCTCCFAKPFKRKVIQSSAGWMLLDVSTMHDIWSADKAKENHKFIVYWMCKGNINVCYSQTNASYFFSSIWQNLSQTGTFLPYSFTHQLRWVDAHARYTIPPFITLIVWAPISSGRPTYGIHC